MEPSSSTTALLVMDMQEGILENYPARSEILDQQKKAIHAAREKNIPVIYVILGFREGLPEVSKDSFFRQRFANVHMETFMRIAPEIYPENGDVVVIKHRFSAFSGSDLDMILRAMGIKEMVLAGVATSGVVLSTLREAIDKDYAVTVLSDCCADSDDEVHRVLLTKIFARHATVSAVNAWAANLS